MEGTAGAVCPVRTPLPHSQYEQAGLAISEIRAYKLGKKRYSYNRVELLIAEQGGNRRASVQQAANAGTQVLEHQDSAVSYLVQLGSGQKLLVHLYLCFSRSTPVLSLTPTSAGATEAAAVRATTNGDTGSGCEYAWQLVTRNDCCKGCCGPVLRAIQRFGRMGKRSWKDMEEEPRAAPAFPAAPLLPAACLTMKDPKYMYISLDEACTHVDAPAFRLVAAVYDASGARLLTSAVSPPVRVLANNDVPTGAARIPLEAHLPADWEGWELEEAAAALAVTWPVQPSSSPEPRRKHLLRSAHTNSSSHSDASHSAEGSQPPDTARPQLAVAFLKQKGAVKLHSATPAAKEEAVPPTRQFHAAGPASLTSPVSIAQLLPNQKSIQPFPQLLQHQQPRMAHSVEGLQQLHELLQVLNRTKGHSSLDMSTSAGPLPAIGNAGVPLSSQQQPLPLQGGNEQPLAQLLRLLRSSGMLASPTQPGSSALDASLAAAHMLAAPAPPLRPQTVLAAHLPPDLPVAQLLQLVASMHSMAPTRAPWPRPVAVSSQAPVFELDPAWPKIPRRVNPVTASAGANISSHPGLAAISSPPREAVLNAMDLLAAAAVAQS